MRSVLWLVFWPVFVSFTFAYLFYILREEPEELPWMVPSGRHFRVRQNQPERAPGWFGGKSYWLLLFFMFFVILRFLGGSDKSNECTRRVRRGRSSGSPGRKKRRASRDKDSMCGALTQVEKEPVNLVSRVRNLKFTAATGEKRRRPNIEVSADAQNKVPVCGVQNTGGSDGVDSHIEEEE